MTKAHLIRGGGGQGMAFIWSQKPPDTVSEIINFKIFLEEHPQTPLVCAVTVVL